MDPTPSTASASPDHESVAFTPCQDKFSGFTPRIIGLSPSMSMRSNSVDDDEYDDPRSVKLIGFGSFGPLLRELPSSPRPDEFTQGMISGSTPAGTPGPLGPNSSHTSLPFNFTTSGETPTQTLRVGNIQNLVSPVLFKIFHEEGDIQEFYTGLLEQEGVIIVTFSQVVDAMVTFAKIKDGGQWSISYTTQNSSYHAEKYASQNQLKCTVISGLSSRNMVPSLYESVAALGDVVDFLVIEQSTQPTFRFTFEDHHAATSVAAMLDGQYTKCFKVGIITDNLAPAVNQNVPTEIIVTSEIEDQGIWSPRPRYGIEPLPTQVSPFAGLGYVWHPNSRTSGERSPLSPSSHWSDHSFSPSQTSARTFLFPGPPSFRSQSSVGSVESRDSFRNTSPSSSYEPKRPSHLAVPGKNVINLERIAIGGDTRTTVMLRNIPNKVDQETLKEYIDETSRGLYNFLYLRIDFRNICNVGYAFINFLDPLDIIEFVQAKSGTRWNKFNSEKVLDVTYANIQGIDQLIEKFRNSSVMDQDPTYRPKLFHSSGPLAGTEAEFPPPNNILKKCRSVTAAQQIGLFAPKSSPAHTKSCWRKKD